MHDEPFIPNNSNGAPPHNDFCKLNRHARPGTSRDTRQSDQCILRAKLLRREHKFMQQQCVPTEFRLLPQSALICCKPNVNPVDAKHGIGRGPPHIDDTQPVKAQGRTLRRALLRSPLGDACRYVDGVMEVTEMGALSSERRPGFVSCGSGFSLVRGGKGVNKRFERNRTHSSRQLKCVFQGQSQNNTRLGRHPRLPSSGGGRALMPRWRFGGPKYGRVLGARDGLGPCVARVAGLTL